MSRRLRLLVLAPFPPQAGGRHGGARALAGAVSALGRHHEVGVLHLPDPEGSGADPASADSCAFVEALPAAPVRGARRWLRRLGLHWALVRGVPVWASELGNPAAAKRVCAVAAGWRPDIVQIDMLPTAVFLDALDGTGARRVLVDYDAASRPPYGFDHLPAPVGRILRFLDRRAWRRFERRAAAHVDAIVVFTERDRKVAERLHAPRTVRIPLALPARDRPLSPVGQPAASVLFTGYFRHPPNADAARWLVHDIFPRVRADCPDATLVLVGEGPPADVQGLEGQGVTVTGAVADVSGYLDRAAVVAAPIRTGGGVRVKVLEALGAGKAVVATPLAAEGIDAPAGDAILLAGSAAEFADCLVQLLGDEERRRTLGANAYAWAQEHLGWDAAVAQYERLYAELLT